MAAAMCPSCTPFCIDFNNRLKSGSVKETILAQSDQKDSSSIICLVAKPLAVLQLRLSNYSMVSTVDMRHPLTMSICFKVKNPVERGVLPHTIRSIAPIFSFVNFKTVGWL
ncbi:hypothetical protein HanPSC8_Chr01g0020381 [Helianthus annuus]|nr:hypothetical protein HanPSC8_Chr01g0020381 [Helianthus annuus]